MRAVDIIIKKRDKLELTKEEIDFFIQGFSDGDIPDYQASAWAMAVQLNGMSARETTDLTLAMVASGDTQDLSEIVKVAVDKHSTGGVGDKTTLAVEPIVAACGLPVGKMSGRGLGFSGGTLDKMESIPGFRVDLTTEEFLKQLKEVGLVLTGQTGDLAPADGKFYALRDVTGTVPSLPLIAASIMSKKIAAGAQKIVLDVKAGVGAFMSNVDEARALAEAMVAIGKLAGRETVALLSDMNQPLGVAVGNALEVKEAIATLHGEGPEDFYGHVLEVATHLLILGGAANSEDEAKKKIEAVIKNGKAWERFRDLVIAQGGDVSYIDDPDKLAKAPVIETVNSPRGGYISGINARVVGETSVVLGAGRAKKSDSIDHSVGIEIFFNVGDLLVAGEALFAIHAKSQLDVENTRQILLDAHTWSDEEVQPLPLFYGVVK
ncbi:MAG: thymidine phosphorylase [Chloroflexota bacterium]